jgi:quercetin dioxygenase-like cupin family protein
MKVPLSLLLTGAIIVAGAASSVPAQTMDAHKIVYPHQINWTPGPASIPRGAEAATLFGDPAKEELFALRLKLPNGYHIAPHSHPKPEVVTVISGTVRLGMGDMADKDKALPLLAGSLFSISPGMAHFVYAEGETVLQLNSVGPWSLTYVNPKDDPRQKTQ